VLAIKGDQARRFCVGAFNDPRVASICIQPIKKPRQQDCTGPVDAFDPCEIDTDGPTTAKTGFRAFDFLLHRHRMR
jgi:hypothetical protein